MTDINKLEELAKAATPGPWSNEKLEDGIHEVCAHDGSDWEILICNTRREDADYIAAANPAEILAIISQYRRMEEALKGADAWLERWASHVGACRGGGLCECGLTAIQYETRGALQDQDQ